MLLIIFITIILYLVSIAWTWHSLEDVKKSKKILYISIGFIVTYVITLIIFNISKGEIQYQKAEIQNQIQNILVAVFAGINSIITMPYIGKLISKIHEGEIDKTTVLKKILIIVVIFIICIIFESGYMQDTQEGILNIYNTRK